MPMTSLAVRNLLFTLVVPGLGAVVLPWWILTRSGGTPVPTGWYAVGVIAAGAALYLACVWIFAVVGRGTPGPWDPPQHFVAVGPYRWVRNPIYLAALLVVLGEAWLFVSVAAGLRGRDGDLLPPVRDWVRGADVAPGVRPDICRVHAQGATLASRAGAAQLSPSSPALFLLVVVVAVIRPGAAFRSVVGLLTGSAGRSSCRSPRPPTGLCRRCG